MLTPDIPIELGREPAHRLAVAELSDPAYRAAEPSLVSRAIDWLVDQVSRLVEGAGAIAPGGWLGILGLLLMLAVAVLVVRWRMGPVSRSDRAVVMVDPSTSSAQYRARAEELARAGQWDLAVSERMRALVRTCQERALIDTRPGWTADEVARAASAGVPGSVTVLEEAARTFDDVRYGGRTGSAQAYALVARADDAVAAAPVVAR